MKYLESFENSKDILKEELFLAEIPIIEEGNKIFGRIGNWYFERRSSYWSALVKEERQGLPLEFALVLHNKINPLFGKKLGYEIRSGGHAGAPSPDVFGANIIFDEKLRKQILSLEEKYGTLTFDQILEKEKTGEIEIERFVDCYHIDTQIGLNEFSQFIKKYINKNVFITLIDERIDFYIKDENLKSTSELISDSKVVTELKEFKNKIIKSLC